MYKYVLKMPKCVLFHIFLIYNYLFDEILLLIMIEDEIWDLAGYVSASSYRKKIIYCLGESVKIPSEIGKEVGLRTNHVSNILRDLKKLNLIVCLNDHAKKGRLYKLTDLGLKVKDVLDGDGD